MEVHIIYNDLVLNMILSLLALFI